MRGVIAWIAVALSTTSCNSQAPAPLASATAIDACSPTALGAAATYTPIQPASPTPSGRMVSYPRRDGSRGRSIRLRPPPLQNGVCDYQFPDAAKRCSAEQLNTAMGRLDAARMTILDYTVDLDCAPLLSNGQAPVARYVQLWAELTADQDICAHYEAYDARLAAMEATPPGAPGAIRELSFVRGHLAEICVGDDAALTHYVRALRAGFLPAGLRATQVIEERSGHPDALRRPGKR